MATRKISTRRKTTTTKRRRKVSGVAGPPATKVFTINGVGRRYKKANEGTKTEMQAKRQKLNDDCKLARVVKVGSRYVLYSGGKMKSCRKKTTAVSGVRRRRTRKAA